MGILTRSLLAFLFHALTSSLYTGGQKELLKLHFLGYERLQQWFLLTPTEKQSISDNSNVSPRIFDRTPVNLRNFFMGNTYIHIYKYIYKYIYIYIYIYISAHTHRQAPGRVHAYPYTTDVYVHILYLIPLRTPIHNP